MSKQLRPPRGLWPLALVLTACGAPAAKAPQVPAKLDVSASAKPAEAPPVATAAPEPKPERHDSPGFEQAMALLRPAATESAAKALAAAPALAEPYAQAALAYAATDLPGMTLLYGLSYQAMGGGSADGAVATALAKVLVERITARLDEQTKDVNFNLRLAPGQMPARQEPDGAVYAPVAHVFETLFSPAVTGFRPPWSIEQFYDVLSTWTGLIATRGTALDESLPLDGWLVMTAKAGQLEPYCYQLLGPAFPAELKTYKAKNAAALKAYKEFSKSSPLSPKRAVMPDDLVRIQ
jgi:hypothetical protein